jgi:hypothetical protein
MAGGGNNPLGGRLIFALPSVAGVLKMFNFAATYWIGGGFLRSVTAGGSYGTDSNPINGIRFLPSLPSGGNFTAGIFILYGVKK